MRRSVILACIVILTALVATLAPAQTPTGTIRGLVTDPSRAVIPGASVKITEVATGRTIELKTTDAGLYTASLLLPGTYRVRMEAGGFAPTELEVEVQAGQAVDANATLKISAGQTKVEVSEVTAALQIDTTRSTVDGVITAQQIDQLPLNARNFLELAALEPGVLIRDGGAIDPTKSSTYRTVGIVGRSGTGTRVQIDGIDVTDETVGTTVANISDDAVEEFQLTRSSLDLSTSLTSSGAVNIISRTGSNDIHGAFFYFYRNQDMAARPQFLVVGPNPPFSRKQIGYRAGGPFIKNKLFWFTNWERTYQEEQGIFRSDANFPIVPFGSSNNCLQKCLGGIPLGIRMVDARLDWNVRSNIRLFYRFGHDWNITTGGTVPVSPFQNVDWTNTHSIGLDWSHGRLTHSYRFGYVNFNNRIVSQQESGFSFPTTSQGTPYFLQVGAYQLGPNGLAPQQTDQDNFQNKYDGSLVWGKHTFRYGMEVNRIILGGFANFAGPLSVFGDFSDAIRTNIVNRGDNPQDPLQYPLVDFSTGPNNGFFTLGACHGFKYGCHKNTRVAWYFGDGWRTRKNLTLNIGTRWEWDSGYFNNEDQIKRPAYLDYWLKGTATRPEFPKNRFGPQLGFAWDPMSSGKTSIRGGVYVAYEMNIFNNLLFDQNALIPAGIGPDFFSSSFTGKPNGSPITPADIGNPTLPSPCQGFASNQGPNAGDWSCLTDTSLTIGGVLPIIGSIDKALKDAYANFQFNPASGTPQFQTTLGNTFGFLIGGSSFKIPYSVQWNIGFQRELKPNHKLTVDFLYNHGVGMPFLGEDFECRRCASTLNAAKAQAAVNSYLAANGFASIDAAIAAGKKISNFGLATDSIFQGRTPDPASAFPETQTINFLRARIMGSNGFSKYIGVQTQLVGRTREKHLFVRALNYKVSYAVGRADSTNGSSRSEFLNTALNKLAPRGSTYFGPNSDLDRTHMVGAGVLTDLLFGFRVGQNWTFQTAPPASVFIPALAISGRNAIFSTDFNGDGNNGSGSPLPDVLPGINLGQFGRDANSWSQLNKIISTYNATFAGQLTPAGKALVAAGIFTEAQLKALKAVFPLIQQVPTGNPWPFDNLFNVNMSVTRPIKLGKIREGFVIEPWFQVFNVFNHTGLGQYPSMGLGETFGSLNFDYRDPANQSLTECGGNCLANLTNARGRNADTRIYQIGVRVSF